MITKKEFKDLDIEKQVNLVNEELSKAKGTKNFSKFELDFSYGFARAILTNEGYDTLEEKNIDGTKVKLFRKMNEDELKEKEDKDTKKKEEQVQIINEQTVISSNIEIDINMKISKDIYDKNIDINSDKKTISRPLPIFEDTYEEFLKLLQSNEFKLYEKKYVVELMIRNFLEKYKTEETENEE